jgi:hypothetical protein
MTSKQARAKHNHKDTTYDGSDTFHFVTFYPAKYGFVSPRARMTVILAVAEDRILP